MLIFRYGPEPAQFPEGASVREPRAQPPRVLHHRRQDPRLRRQLPAQGEAQSAVMAFPYRGANVIDRFKTEAVVLHPVY